MYERLELLLAECNITVYKLAKETGIARSTFSNWKKRNYTPKMDKMRLIADYFHVSVEWLLGYDVPRNPYDIHVDLPSCLTENNVILTQDTIQNLPDYLKNAASLFQADQSLIVSGTPLSQQNKERIQSILNSAAQSIEDILGSL